MGYRVLKGVTLGLPSSDGGTGQPLFSADIFPSLRLADALFDGTDYERDATTEEVYLTLGGVSFGRMLYDPTGTLPTKNGATQHILLEIGDQLGSGSVVVDNVTGQLVERSTYQAYGAADSDYRNEAWLFWEPYRFTGAETDIELGLSYFGARYYSPMLGRWMSADPAVVHGFQSDPNAYAYAGGAVLSSIDPLGLDIENGVLTVPVTNITSSVTPDAQSASDDNASPVPRQADPFAVPGWVVAGKNALDQGNNIVNPIWQAGHWLNDVRRAALDSNASAKSRAWSGVSAVVAIIPFGGEATAAEQGVREIARTIEVGREVNIVRAGAEEIPQAGGAFAQVKAAIKKAGVTGGETHKMPSWGAVQSAGGVPGRLKSASIWMLLADHQGTKSWGSSARAVKYQAEQAQLIREGRYLDALKKDVEDIRAVHGDKYDVAIQQMGEYVWGLFQ